MRNARTKSSYNNQVLLARTLASPCIVLSQPSSPFSCFQDIDKETIRPPSAKPACGAVNPDCGNSSTASQPEDSLHVSSVAQRPGSAQSKGQRLASRPNDFFLRK
eukprot:scaffold659099_cov62-Prasinocladus_malaysianus.AAC.1